MPAWQQAAAAAGRDGCVAAAYRIFAGRVPG